MHRSIAFYSCDFILQHFPHAVVCSSRSIVAKADTTSHLLSPGKLGFYQRFYQLVLIIMAFLKLYVITDKLLQLIHFFTPSSGLLVSNFDGDRFSVACGCRIFRVVIPLCVVESRYEQLVQDFLCDCVNNLEPVSLLKNFAEFCLFKIFCLLF